MSGRALRACAIACVGAFGMAADWPSWRGPARDGVVREPPPAAWPIDLAAAWKAEVGAGHASPIVVGGKVFVFTRSGDEEVLQAFDAKTGKPAWRTAYAAPYDVNPEAATHGAGPKSTPAFAAGRIFTLGIGGVLSAFDATTGASVWRKSFSKEFPKTSPLYGTAASPIVEEGLVMAHVGGHDKGSLRAFNAADGGVRWSWDGDGPGYASPVLTDLAGERHLITQTQNNVVALSPSDGRLLWKVSFRTEYDQNAVTPLVWHDLVILSGYDKPVVALRVAKQGGSLEATEAWKNAEAAFYMSSPVAVGDRVFGFSHRQKGQLVCIDAASGRTVWKSPGRLGENASLVAWGDSVLALTDGAELIVFSASGDAFVAGSRLKAAGSATWASPAVADGSIFVKDAASLACFRLPAAGK